MRVALFNIRNPKTGAGKLNLNLFLSFQKLRKKVDLIHMGKGEFGYSNVRHIPPYPFPIGEETLNWLFYLPRKIPPDYDVYHIADPLFATFVDHCSPTVLTIFDFIYFYINRPFIASRLMRFGLKKARKADKIIALSEAVKDETIRILKVPEEKIVTIYEGIDHKTFKPRPKLECREMLGLGASEKIILHVGTETSRKNVPTLIKSFYRLQKEEEDVKIVRIGRMSEEVGALIRKFDLEDKIVYKHNVDEKDLAYYYNAADLFVTPLYYGADSLPTFEAIASGTPVVGGNIPSMFETVGDAGILIDPFDDRKLTAVMNEILTDQELQKSLGEKSYNRSKLFSWEKSAKKTYDVYEEVYNNQK